MSCNQIEFENENAIKKGSSWRNFTNLEKKLIFFSIFIFFLFCIIIGLYISTFYTQQNVCETPECIAMSDQLFSYMDPGVDPCDDFYQYACGGWIKSHRDGNNAIRTYDLMQHDVNKRIKNYLESDWKSQSEPLNAIFNQVKVFYNSCLNDDSAEENDLNEYKMLTLNMLNIHSNKSDLFTDLFTAMFQVSANPFFNIDIGFNSENHSNGIIVEVFTSQPSQYDLVMDQNSIKLIGMQNIFKEIYPKQNLSLEDCYSLFDQFSNAFENIISEQEKIHEKMSISQLQKIFGKVNWIKLLTTLYGFQFYSDDKILVEDPQYMANLNRLFQSYSDKELKMLTTFYVTIVAANDMFYEKNRDKCLYFTKKYLPLSLSLLFVESSSPTLLASIEKDSAIIFESLKKTLSSTINNCDWMSPETKKKFLKKLSLIDAHFGKLIVSANNPVFKDILQVKLLPDNFLKNVISLSAKNLLIDRNDYKQFIMGKNKHLYGLIINSEKESYVINAFNFLSFNQIAVYMAMFYPPRYMMNVPKYVSFGKLGNTIAHEMHHSFDINGYQFDEEGNLNQLITEDSDEEQQFAKKIQCFIDNYPIYFDELIKTRPGYNKYIQLNGTITLSENMADSGIKVAFQAYKSVSSANEQLLPGLKEGNISKDQVFFLSIAQRACATNSLIDYPKWLTTATHTPDPERVNLMMMNSDDFSKVFNCSSQSRMNVKPKCSIW